MIKLLGDVHLGKRFKNNVPLHRRGDRERMQWAEFEAHLNDVSPGDIHIQVGDLFDEAIVPYGVIFRAARAYAEASGRNPQVKYILYRGNHDASRDVEKITAFQIFKLVVASLSPGRRIEIYDDVPGWLPLEDEKEVHVFLPWHPVETAKELVAGVAGTIENAIKQGFSVIAYGHWDVDRRQEASDNYVPAAELAALGVSRVVTGHDHNKRDEIIAGIPVHVTGSMQPYDHSQDGEERLYVTRTLAQVLADPDAFVDKNLRITMARDEVLDIPIDCLSLIVVREGVEETGELNEVDFEAFDLDQLLGQAINQVGLRPDVAEKVREKISEKKLEDDDQNVA
ncbi:metallo-dependent phosphatase [Caulobacter phage Seuss]|uniref:Metallo-dependent phosphatase n=1 Tax=Caulobacter phage Seuss TaxID=1675601 RepID=A0A0K1LN03_9CAUD|nr:metallo-dependent phosphatase [Caulobacter phage Seuss]AKU43588.1 metallo-dependent phosphatase [Caulobacter phage Seuss]